MTDREKVIVEIEDALSDNLAKVGLAYNLSLIELKDKALTDALALLKEQEAVELTWSRGKPFCGACGLRIHGGKFCSERGKPILWEGGQGE